MNSNRNRGHTYGTQERPIRSDGRSPSRPARPIRSDADSRRGRYGTYGYSGSPGHPSAYAGEADERLRELIRERLTEDPDIDARNVVIDASDGRVTLSGTVVDERTRDIIEQCVENCGAQAVANRLSVAM